MSGALLKETCLRSLTLIQQVSESRFHFYWVASSMTQPSGTCLENGEMPDYAIGALRLATTGHPPLICLKLSDDDRPFVIPHIFVYHAMSVVHSKCFNHDNFRIRVLVWH